MVRIFSKPSVCGGGGEVTSDRSSNGRGIFSWAFRPSLRPPTATRRAPGGQWGPQSLPRHDFTIRRRTRTPGGAGLGRIRPFHPKSGSRRRGGGWRWRLSLLAVGSVRALWSFSLLRSAVSSPHAILGPPPTSICMGRRRGGGPAAAATWPRAAATPKTPGEVATAMELPSCRGNCARGGSAMWFGRRNRCTQRTDEKPVGGYIRKRRKKVGFKVFGNNRLAPTNSRIRGHRRLNCLRLTSPPPPGTRFSSIPSNG